MLFSKLPAAYIFRVCTRSYFAYCTLLTVTAAAALENLSFMFFDWWLKYKNAL